MLTHIECNIHVGSVIEFKSPQEIYVDGKLHKSVIKTDPVTHRQKVCFMPVKEEA